MNLNKLKDKLKDDPNMLKYEDNKAISVLFYFCWGFIFAGVVLILIGVFIY